MAVSISKFILLILRSTLLTVSLKTSTAIHVGSELSRGIILYRTHGESYLIFSETFLLEYNTGRDGGNDSDETDDIELVRY
jgi:hypothetical protein